MSQSQITHAAAAIHNPADPRHFMRIRTLSRRIRVWRGDVLVADCGAPRLLQEVGRDFYLPAFYLPQSDLLASLAPHAAQTHCPLKGDASYFDLLDENGNIAVAKAAWTYGAPLAFALELKGLVAFYPEHFAFEDRPLRD
ncbi:MAG: DUF427 domain-containing protein [Neomegalonema sp.]|nr:DUF427 domain-containing protein [Neomegalonema sp.]